MKSNRKDVSKQNMENPEMDRIITTCRQFEDLRLTVPILSVYERRGTKFKDHLFQVFRRKKDATEVV